MRNAIEWMRCIIRKQLKKSPTDVQTNPVGKIETTLKLFTKMLPSPMQNTGSRARKWPLFIRESR